MLVEHPVVDQRLGTHQRLRQRVDAADVPVEQVDPVHALAAQLGVEVEPTGREAAGRQDLEEHGDQLLDGVGELVGVPTVLRVAPVGVDAAEDAVGDGVGHLVVERVARQCRVVGLDVDLVLVDQAVAVEEAVHRRAVVVVLVLGRLLGLRLEEQGPGEADPVLVLGHQVQEPGELVALPAEVGVEQGLVALASTPEDIVLPTQTVGCLEGVPDLGGRVDEDLRVGVGRGTGGVPGVGEQVGRPPQQADPGLGHLLRGAVHQPVEVVPRRLQRVPRGGHVDVVEAVERRAQLGEELEGRILLGERGLQRVRDGVEPRPVEGAGRRRRRCLAS